ncbi:uncharacterized protein LACBIDRAFT_295327 [Laccaria bicolor S238N-H82]|uniref:Predicted protein n=1 Tax=Laccaria bicolor (strain S238N-H82 / ATCC MYA-4686) TaxID=486041 RepID=B0DQK7_LACBS|nr:uncharacterized protein LACBIDRAFT_295327 [Laccaria bicolor S238N-H82]EDR03131.1 predicted protein [Laccaria bicolor S238N-H82]|eukprot:XP_001886272.1 predicted protein [Laccaria bicolor S238N-H82]
MHAFNFTRPFALVLAIVCLAIAAPTSDVHAAGNVPDSAVIKDTIATHLPAATSPTDETGGSTLKPDSSECFIALTPCAADKDCCSGLCKISLSAVGLGLRCV